MTDWIFGGLLTGIKDDYTEGKKQTIPDAGANFERETFTTTKDIITGNLKMKYPKFVQFQDFYKDTKQGSEYFDYLDCRLGLERQARFYGNWQAKENNGWWTINLSLILEPIRYNVNLVLGYNNCPASYNGEKAGVKTNYEL